MLNGATELNNEKTTCNDKEDTAFRNGRPSNRIITPHRIAITVTEEVGTFRRLIIKLAESSLQIRILHWLYVHVVLAGGEQDNEI